MQIIIPNDALEIIYTLEEHGFEAYVVGGCVRDSLLGKEPKDWDITTNATPEEVIDLFASNTTVIPTGIEHGTVTILFQSGGYEVTTYRIDGKYTDSRRPDEVQFTTSLKEDLARRDFTINAMAYNPNEGLVDPFNGCEDLQNRIVKCVGKPADRFQEDYLRIVRAYRFAIVYDFRIDEKTYNAAKLRLSLGALDDLSKERLQAELDKMLAAPIEQDRFELFLEIFEDIIKQGTKNPDEIYIKLDEESAFRIFDVLEGNDRLAWMLFIYYDTLEQAEEILKGLKYSNDVRIYVVRLLQAYNEPIENVVSLKRMIRSYGFDLISHMLYLRHYVYPMDAEILGRIKQLNAIRNQNQVVFLNQLAITGDDIIANLGMKPGRKIGELLESAYTAVIENTLRNDKEELLKYLRYLLTK